MFRRDVNREPLDVCNDWLQQLLKFYPFPVVSTKERRMSRNTIFHSDMEN